MSRNKQLKNIEKIIRKLDGPMETLPSADQMMRYEKTLFQEIDKMIPEYLYKYRKGRECDLDALSNKRIFLSIPAEFNDPTESMAYVDTNRLVMTSLSLPDDFILFESADYEDSQNNYLEKRTNLMNGGLKYIQENRSRVRICSLSEVIDSPLMWTHYANEHKGFAIQYRTDAINFEECNSCRTTMCRFCHRRGKPIFPVVYEDDRFDATHMAIANAIYKESKEDDEKNQELPFPLLTVIQKSKDWSYEKEWRLVCNNVENMYFALKPNAIFMGALIDSTLACKLANIARELKIPLYKMEVDYFSPCFNLTYASWSDYSDDNIKQFVHPEGPIFG